MGKIKTGKNLKCLECKKTFYAPAWWLRMGAKYCSRRCSYPSRKNCIPWNKGLRGWRKGEPHPWKIGQIPKSAFKKGNKLSAKTRKKMSVRMKKDWLSSAYRKKILGKRKMSSLETRVREAIEANKLPYKFVGNGKFFIERKNPDFINTNGEKIAIEVYARRHKENFTNGGIKVYRRTREKIFGKYGWKIIFIEEWQTNSKEHILGLLKGGD